MVEIDAAQRKFLKSLPRTIYFGLRGLNRRQRAALISCQASALLTIHPLNTVLADVAITAAGTAALKGKAPIQAGAVSPKAEELAHG